LPRPTRSEHLGNQKTRYFVAMVEIDLKWLFTTLIALWGAGLSTYQLFVKLSEQRVRLRVELHMDMLMLSAAGRVPMMSVLVKNIGLRDVFFRNHGCSLFIQGSRTALLLNEPMCDVKFPLTVKSGDAFRIDTPRAPFIKALASPGPTGFVRLRAGVCDAVGKWHYSDWFDGDVHKLRASLEGK
jgi:hypothetical protein